MADPALRAAGIVGLTLLTLFVFFHSVGKTDVTWALPWKKPFRLAWPDLPHFTSWTTSTPDGQTETIYQVPTRQLTKSEIAQLSYTPAATNAAPATSSPSRRDEVERLVPPRQVRLDRPVAVAVARLQDHQLRVAQVGKEIERQRRRDDRVAVAADDADGMLEMLQIADRVVGVVQRSSGEAASGPG